MAGFVAPAVRALLANLIDYAGMFPPASLSREAALANYGCYHNAEHAWMLGRFVVPAAQVTQITSLDWPLAVLGDRDDPRATTIESKNVVTTSRPTYCEVSIELLDSVKRAGSFAKFRTGGITPEAIPSVESVASYIVACADRKLAFKATAGLHHPIRSVHALTYELGAPSAMMHGFINVFLAAAFVWRSAQGSGSSWADAELHEILSETDLSAFRFDDCARWHDHSLSAAEVAQARQSFAHSFGSCSFEEPVEELKVLGLL